MIPFKLLVLLSIILIPLIAVVIDAWSDSKNVLNIKHFRGAVIYSLCVAVPYLFFVDAVRLWHLIIIPILSRAAWFDPLFNHFTGNKFTYNGDPNKPKDKHSVIDWLENKTGFSIFALRISYIIIYFAYLTYFIWNYY